MDIFERGLAAAKFQRLTEKHNKYGWELGKVAYLHELASGGFLPADDCRKLEKLSEELEKKTMAFLAKRSPASVSAYKSASWEQMVKKLLFDDAQAVCDDKELENLSAIAAFQILSEGLPEIANLH